MNNKINFSDILQKNIDKHNKKQQDNLKLIQEIKARAKERAEQEQDTEKLKELEQQPSNQINLMDMIK